MNKFISNIKKHPKTILTLIFILLFAAIMNELEVDNRAIALITLVIGFITNIFAGISVFAASIPIIGPILIKLFTIPFFWIINLTGYITSIIAIKKGYKKTIMNHRIIATTLIIGIGIGYILGNLIPVK